MIRPVSHGTYAHGISRLLYVFHSKKAIHFPFPYFNFFHCGFFFTFRAIRCMIGKMTVF